MIKRVLMCGVLMVFVGVLAAKLSAQGGAPKQGTRSSSAVSW